MKNTNTFGVFFYLRKYKKVDGKAPIYARITVNGKRADVSVKQSLEPKHWCGKKGSAKGSRDEIKKLNLFLDQLRAGFISTYQNLLLHHKLITAQIIKQKFLGVDEQEHTLKKIIKYHDDNMTDSLAWGTMKNYGATQRYLEGFVKSNLRADDVRLCDVSYKFVIDFEHYLRTTSGLDEKRPLTNNGVMKHMERFKKLINLAHRMEWIDKDPFQKYQLKFKKTQRQCLSFDELTTIENKEIRSDRLKRVRDMFVFSCYTGLAYADVMALRPDHIAIGIDGQRWIITERIKTNNAVKVPILPKAMEIIKAYLVNPEVFEFVHLFNPISNQKVNEYLKELAKICGINKHLTFHLARHTFATTITLANGVPIESVSKMLGHTSIRTTQIYAKVIESKISEDMTSLRAKLLTRQTTDVKMISNQ